MSFEALVDLLLAVEEEVSLEIEPAQMHACCVLSPSYHPFYMEYWPLSTLSASYASYYYQYNPLV